MRVRSVKCTQLRTPDKRKPGGSSYDDARLTDTDTDRVPSHTPRRDRRDDQRWRNPSRTFSQHVYDERAPRDAGGFSFALSTRQALDRSSRRRGARRGGRWGRSRSWLCLGARQRARDSHAWACVASTSGGQGRLSRPPPSPWPARRVKAVEEEIFHRCKHALRNTNRESYITGKISRLMAALARARAESAATEQPCGSEGAFTPGHRRSNM